ncbi:MAG: amino acid permease [Gemmataceae bacterium]
MSASDGSPSSSGRRLLRAAQVIVVSSVMFTFISYWRTAAVVLCDLASTAYYIGGIVEQSIGPAAPWFILAVMIFSYGVRSVYIESSALYVRGGVYRVVKEAMGGFLAKLSVSALMFDYILTGPISAVSAGQYIIGLTQALFSHFSGVTIDDATRDFWKSWGSVAIAVAITLYFFRQNLLGIHESSDKAVKIMIATTIMAVVIGIWCGVTLLVREAPPINPVPLQPDLKPHHVEDPNEPGKMESPLGFIADTPVAKSFESLEGPDWFSLIGLVGIFIAFGHSILAMSGEETLAQVYREVESPKLPNFKRAAFIVFLYSTILTGGISFLAVALIPNDERMSVYADNLIGGLAMNVVGPIEARLILNAFVVIVGFLILAGAVNTAIIGSNGVLNRVSEDGVMPDWFLKPHPRFGTTHRILYLILGLQLFTIIASRGDVLLLGEAYAFGVVWSFVFKALAMLVLRFKDKRPREFKVPLNVKLGKLELPIGLGLLFVILLIAAIMNLLTKETATIWGLSFTAAFLTIFLVSEHVHERRRKGAHHEHREQFNQQVIPEADPTTLQLKKPYRKLVAIRSTQNLFMLEKAILEADPDTTEVVVMTAKLVPPDHPPGAPLTLDEYDQQLMTAVVNRAEAIGKKVRPLVVPTNNPLHAVLQTAKDIGAQEVVLGASNKFSAEEQIDQIGFYWINLFQTTPPGLTVRILSRDRDVTFDIAGGNRIPKISERQARSVEELRAAGVGIDRVLLAHDGSRASSDLFRSVLTMLDPQVLLDLVKVPGEGPSDGSAVGQDQEQARKLGRDLSIHDANGDPGPTLVRLAREGQFDLIILPESGEKTGAEDWRRYVVSHAHCLVLLGAQPAIPREVEEK